MSTLWFFSLVRRLGGLSLGGFCLIVSSGIFAPALHAETQLVVGVGYFPATLDTGEPSYGALSLHVQMMDPLIARNNDMKLVPSLATSWQVVNPTTWRLTLRQGVQFHNGDPFDADSVKFTLDRIIDPQRTHSLRRRISLIQEVRIIDPFTIEIITTKPFPTLPRGLSDIVIEPKAYITQKGEDAQRQHPIGTGPFRFVEWVPGDHLLLKANDAYWGGRPSIDTVLIRYIPEASTRVAALLAGEAHIIEEVPVDLLPQVEAGRDTKIFAASTTVALCLTMDTTRGGPFANSKVRLAMDYAINKPLIWKEILNGHGRVLDGQLATQHTFGYNPSIRSRPYDPEKAKALLAEAGYPDGFATSITTRSGKYLSDVEITTAISGQLAKIGVQAEVNIVESGVFSKMVQKHDMGPMHIVGWYSLGDADFSTVWFTQDSGRAYWKNDEYEELFVKARTTVDDQEREKIYHRMMEILHEENPAVFLFELPSIFGQSTRVQNWVGRGDKLLNLTRVSLQ